MILVTGSTGGLGKAVLDTLYNKLSNTQFSAMARDLTKTENLSAKGITVKLADYTDYNSMLAAYAGIQRLLLISSNHPTDRFKQHTDVINAAKDAGVKHIIYTGFDMRDLSNSSVMFLSEPHAQTIAYLKNSGIDYTIVNNNVYAELIPGYLGTDVLEKGVFFPAGDGKVPYATRTDMGEAIANLLLQDGHVGKTYVFFGTKAYSFQDIADILSGIAEKKIPYISPDHKDYLVKQHEDGIPGWLAEYKLAFAEAIRLNEFNTSSPSDLRHFLGKDPTSIIDYLKSVYNTSK